MPPTSWATPIGIAQNRGSTHSLEEEIESTEHALLRCPARQYARGSVPETLDLKSAWYDTTTIKVLAAFVEHTLTTLEVEPRPELWISQVETVTNDHSEILIREDTFNCVDAVLALYTWYAERTHDE